MKFPATASKKTCLCYITLTITIFALPALLCADIKVVYKAVSEANASKKEDNRGTGTGRKSSF